MLKVKSARIIIGYAFIVSVFFALKLLLPEDVSASSTLYFPHANHQGSVILVTDESGEVIASNNYHPYGGERGETGDQDIAKRKYTGQIKDTETDIYYYNARYYDPSLSTFLSADSVGGGNRYGYVGGNPINFIDPTGNCLARGVSEGCGGGGGMLFPTGGITGMGGGGGGGQPVAPQGQIDRWNPYQTPTTEDAIILGGIWALSLAAPSAPSVISSVVNLIKSIPNYILAVCATNVNTCETWMRRAAKASDYVDKGTKVVNGARCASGDQSGCYDLAEDVSVEGALSSADYWLNQLDEAADAVRGTGRYVYLLEGEDFTEAAETYGHIAEKTGAFMDNAGMMIAVKADDPKLATLYLGHEFQHALDSPIMNFTENVNSEIKAYYWMSEQPWMKYGYRESARLKAAAFEMLREGGVPDERLFLDYVAGKLFGQ